MLSIDIMNGNVTMSDNEEVASDVPPLYLLDAFSHLYKRVCLSVRRSVRPSVRYTRVEFLRNGLNLSKIVSGTCHLEDNSETRTQLMSDV